MFTKLQAYQAAYQAAVEDSTQTLSRCTLKTLRMLAKRHGVYGRSTMSKGLLVQHLARKAARKQCPAPILADLVGD